MEANIQALAQVLETQVEELLSWMGKFGWERLRTRWLLLPIDRALEELEKKIEAIERVKSDLKAIQQRIIIMQSCHDLKESLRRKQLNQTLKSVYARLDAAKDSERATSDSAIPAYGPHNSAGFDEGKVVVQSIKSARVRA